MTTFEPSQVLDLWFPDDGHWAGGFWTKRMQGGMEQVICRDFGHLT